MTKTSMDLSELLAKHDQGDFLRGLAEAVLQLIMEADVDGLIGAGRIATLLIEAERLILGRIHAASRVIATGNLSDSDVNDLGEYVLTSGGDVIIVPTAKIAARTGAAGIYRF